MIQKFKVGDEVIHIRKYWGKMIEFSKPVIITGGPFHSGSGTLFYNSKELDGPMYQDFLFTKEEAKKKFNEWIDANN